MTSAPTDGSIGIDGAASGWLKAAVVFSALAVVGIGYLIYLESRPTIGDTFREAVEVQFGEAAITLKVDLLNLRSTQQMFFEEHGRYAQSVEEIDFYVSDEHVEMEILRWDENGWHARGVHVEAGIACEADNTTPVVAGRYLADCAPLPENRGRERAYFDAMKFDLKHLASQQEIYFYDQGKYTDSFTDMGFMTVPEVTVVISASAGGWSATATHSGLGMGEGCAIYYGSAAAPTSPAQPPAPGEVACTR